MVSGKELVRDAYELGLKYDLAIYDSVLLALAEKVKHVILTTDEKLLRGVKTCQEISKVFYIP